MNSFELKVWDDEGSKCTFYTVQYENDPLSETDKFFSNFENPDTGYLEDIQVIADLILHSIGSEYGATDAFFTRRENWATALPPKKYRATIPEIMEISEDFPLRLFCLRISESIVVLFNGGVKTGRTAQESDLSIKFYEAQTMAKRILDAINDGMILVPDGGRILTDFKKNKEIIL